MAETKRWDPVYYLGKPPPTDDDIKKAEQRVEQAARHVARLREVKATGLDSWRKEMTAKGVMYGD